MVFNDLQIGQTFKCKSHEPNRPHIKNDGLYCKTAGNVCVDLTRQGAEVILDMGQRVAPVALKHKVEYWSYPSYQASAMRY